MDCICIKNLEVYCHHGVLPEENALGQKFLVTAHLFMDVGKAGRSDDIKDSVSYADAAHHIKNHLKDNTYQLIESVAERLAYSLLKQYPRLDRVTLEVKKPWAPILLPLETVSVKISRRWHLVYLSVGSNMGDREGYLNQALDALRGDSDCREVTASQYIVTKPECEVEQEDFLNAALRLRTLKTPEALLRLLNQVEADLGRVRTVRHGPRTIDLDILAYDDLVVHTDELTIPHKEMGNRYFVLEPLSKLAPEWVHPIFKKNAWELLEDWKRRNDGGV